MHLRKSACTPRSLEVTLATSSSNSFRPLAVGTHPPLMSEVSKEEKRFVILWLQPKWLHISTHGLLFMVFAEGKGSIIPDDVATMGHEEGANFTLLSRWAGGWQVAGCVGRLGRSVR